MPLPTPAQLPLTALCLTGAFSRLTHGAYTPAFHAYQTARQPDDGSATALIVPLVDLTLAGALVLGPRAWKRGAAALAGFAQGAGAVGLVLGKGWAVTEVWGDVLVLGMCALAWMGG